MNGFISLNQLAYGQATIEERMLIDSGTQFEKHVKVFQNDPILKMFRQKRSKKYMRLLQNLKSW